jgi:hypothetical protein
MGETDKGERKTKQKILFKAIKREGHCLVQKMIDSAQGHVTLNYTIYDI